ncbi:MAG: hypothetical protein VW437_00945 [Betaproteobacteria bacterium]
MNRLSKKRNLSLRVLVLDIYRFGDEIKELNKRTDIEFISCPIAVQDKINAVSYYNFKAKENKLTYSLHREKYLKLLLPVLKENIKFDAILSAGMYYRRNQEWEGACVELSIPFVCLHKEGVIREKCEIDNSYSFDHVNKFRRFYGTKIIFGSSAMRDRLCELGYVEKAKTSVITPARFDNVFESSVTKTVTGNSNKPLVVLFSFFPWAGLSRADREKSISEGCELSWTNLYEEVHSAVIRIALDFDVDVVIKPKWYSGETKDMLDGIVKRESGKDPCEIPSLRVLDNISAQDLIEAASVIVAFNSTTMVEALLMNKPVIVPIFAEAKGSMFQFVRYKNYLDSFITANSKADLISLIGARIKKHGSVYNSDEHNFNFKKVEKLISECVGSFDGKNSKRIERELISLCLE